jgi:ABC-type multidrug transport system fused ATPase/permease subunit
MVAGSVALLASIIASAVYIYAIMQKRARRKLGQYHGLNEELSLSLSWHNIECSIGRRRVLNDISGVAHPGQICAILGPSGIQYSV